MNADWQKRRALLPVVGWASPTQNLEPQNVPGNLVGFILALYAFRSVTAEHSRANNDAATKKTDAYARRCS